MLDKGTIEDEEENVDEDDDEEKVKERGDFATW